MPAGRLPVVMLSAGAAIPMENVADAVSAELVPDWLLTSATKPNDPALVGVPKITPVEGFSWRPGGRVP